MIVIAFIAGLFGAGAYVLGIRISQYCDSRNFELTLSEKAFIAASLVAYCLVCVLGLFIAIYYTSQIG